MVFRSGRRRVTAAALPSLLLITILGATSSSNFSNAADTLFKGRSIAVNETLVSAGGVFALGFFTTGSGGHYLGIWYNNISVQTPVWVANRDRPLLNAAGGLSLIGNGTLAVIDEAGGVYWGSDSAVDWFNSSAQLGDDGNFVLRAGDESNTTLWQSFDHPTDTFIPGMQITMDRATRVIQRFVSWRSPEDPAPGPFSLGLDPFGSGQVYIWNGSTVRWRSGQWNKVSFIGITRMSALSLYGFNIDPNVNGKMVLKFNQFNSSLLKFVMQWNGIENTSIWEQENQRWKGIWLQPLTDCETYNFCGNYSICDDSGESKCTCLKGFVPKTAEEWAAGNWSGGCTRRTILACQRSGTNSSSSGGGDRFVRFDNVKLPDFSDWASPTDEAGCGDFCARNCSCAAYAYVAEIGCMTWARGLMDLAQFNGTGGNTFYLKLAGSEFASSDGDGKSKIWIIWVVLPVLLGVILCLSMCLWWRYKSKIKDWWKKGREGRLDASTRGSALSRDPQQDFSGPREVEDDPNEGKPSDLPMFSFDAIAAATDSFSDSNKLGQGGFGHVYHGVLPGGDEIAVKRLSRSSGQGVDEFKNELTLIAKLQHRNLVKLLGCCIQGDEKMLIYEYMANKSLDRFLFDPAKQPLLDWGKRIDIIEGIARGLLYLHRDSRLRIVHRDLKASNILLDVDLNPKISDFGMARIFGGNQNHDNTNRVVGTFGYMSPEYAMEGLFSVKSDVYSFGVLMLEIVSGRKNSRTRSDNYTNLLGYAWQLWTSERAEDIIDPCIRGACPTTQVLRCIHIGLLCVQDRAYERPTMSSVVIMLGSDAAIHQVPKQPTFAAEGSPSETDSQKHEGGGFSVNDVTITVLTGR